MSTITLMRLYLRMQNMPRLPFIGNAGITHNYTWLDRQRLILRDEAEKCTGSPELVGCGKTITMKGSIGGYGRHWYSTSATVEDIKKAEKARESKNKFKVKTAETMKIMLVSETGSLTAATLLEANKIAKKKGLQLVHIQNERDKPVKTEKEVYKLISKVAGLDEANLVKSSLSLFNLGCMLTLCMSLADAEEVKSNERENPIKQRVLKTVLLKSNIGEHDATSKLNVMKKWIEKGYRVRVSISQAGDKGDAETLFKTIETKMAEVEGQIQQKITKGKEIRFYVGSPKKTSKNKSETAADTSKGKSNRKMNADNHSGSSSDDEVDEKKSHIS